jgi:hypothetical protein
MSMILDCRFIRIYCAGFDFIFQCIYKYNKFVFGKSHLIWFNSQEYLFEFVELLIIWK